MRVTVATACIVLSLVGCRKKEPTFEAQLADGMAKNGIAVPAADGPSVAIPRDGCVFLVKRGRVEADFVSSFAASPQGTTTILSLDPSRTATEDAEVKFKRKAGDTIIVPLLNVAASFVDRGAHRTIIVSASEPPPARVYQEIRATLAEAGLKEQYKLVKTSTGELAAQALPTP